MGQLDSLIKAYEDAGLDKDDPDGYAKLLKARDAEELGDSYGRRVLIVHKEAELVLRSLDAPSVVLTVKCKNCKEFFATNYAYQRYCGNECLKAALLAKGLIWDPSKPPEERWKGEPPSVLSPDSLRSLRKWAKHILETVPEEPQLIEHPEKDSFDQLLDSLR